MRYDRLSIAVTYVIGYIYLIMWYINEVVPKDLNSQEWYIQTTSYIGLFLVFLIPFALGAYLSDKYWVKDK